MPEHGGGRQRWGWRCAAHNAPARKHDKALVIHDRDAHDDTLAMAEMRTTTRWRWPS
jgi:hypothetical protein